ncbi:hypothetical protein, partial [Novacetimonas hansenii]|uniref:hypothetical protein n=1 Tax=Novacetimonas hansenii TaxID=436 RepID=UPI001C4B1934
AKTDESQHAGIVQKLSDQALSRSADLPFPAYSHIAGHDGIRIVQRSCKNRSLIMKAHIVRVLPFFHEGNISRSF